mgnify:CR=1 FL=1
MAKDEIVELVDAAGEVRLDLVEMLGDEPVQETVEWRHRPTHAAETVAAPAGGLARVTPSAYQPPALTNVS